MALFTAVVASPPSSSTTYSTLAEPILAGSNLAELRCGTPMTEAGPVLETNTPILMSAAIAVEAAESAHTSAARAKV
ncbi:MAG: hypothetical protein ABI671_01690 [Burkholderiales bacterium]